MYKIKTLNPISDKIFTKLDKNYAVSADMQSPDAILVRSADMHAYAVEQGLRAVARAGAGVNNIPTAALADKGVVVFNTPGANANAVKELVLAGMLLAARDIVGGIEWAATLTADVAKTVEKGKNKFSGTEILGKRLGVIGLGAIGALVANMGVALGMDVIGYDPYIPAASVAILNPGVKTATLNEVIAAADYLTLHVPLLDSTRGFINAESLANMKKGAVILNMARAELVNISDIKSALAAGLIKNYVVDFPTEEAINVKGIIAVPHLGASTEEAEDNCAVMAAAQLKDFLENGNITNSVNYPNITVERTKKNRLTVTYHTTLIGGGMLANEFDTDCEVKYAEKGSIGYLIADSDSLLTEMAAHISTLTGVENVQNF